MDQYLFTMVGNIWESVCENVGGSEPELWALMASIVGEDTWRAYQDEIMCMLNSPYYSISDYYDDRPEYDIDDRVHISRVR